ncbi:hypothetical protein B0H16DRAFT_1529719 [Mycena metata]|uniref:Uncharacterized protein n=1 Tax=Mycena metata TaxID=1033252 RepID=A0AAD7JGA5_9AGAR|nr:hypothetical protein B0H16DRAFT_1529719 [Mycena metata]
MVSILCDLYPSSLGKWDQRAIPPGYAQLAYDPVLALTIGVRLNIRQILPVALYEVCCRIGLDKIVHAIELEVNYQSKCIVGYAKLVEARRTALTYLTREEDQDECETTAACDGERLRWLSLDIARDSEELDPLDDSNSESWDAFGACSVCRTMAKERWVASRHKLWNDLPRIFDLGTWNELLGEDKPAAS